MTVRDVMSNSVIRIAPEEPVQVAARMLEHYNIGVLPVCGRDGRLCGVVTDRDLVTRCLAGNLMPDRTTVREIMTTAVVSTQPNVNALTAASLMAARQIHRLPVLENGRLCGMVSLSDLARRQETAAAAGGALTDISSNIR